MTHPLDPDLGGCLTDSVGRALRTPLHSLMGFLELMAMSPVDADQRRLLDQLVDSSEDLLAASDRLVALLRLLSGAHTTSPRRVLLAHVAEEVVATSRAPLSLDVAAGAPTELEVDVDLLLGLLAELVANAHAHGGAPAGVVVEPAPHGHVRITVRDAGAGMAPAAEQLLLGTAAQPWAAGALGLLLVRESAAALGATVAVGAGPSGTRVEVDLPPVPPVPAEPRAALAPAVPAPRAGGAAAPPPAPPRALHVLLVEDNATNRLLTARQLEHLGHRLTAVTTGQDGVGAAADPDVDVVLMDLHLPDVDGAEATRRILATGRAVPVLAITADATAAAERACRAAGMVGVLTKPVDVGDLAAALLRATAAGGGPGSDAGSGTCGTAGGRPPVPVVVRRIAERVDGDPVAVALFVSTYLRELPARRLRVQAALRRAEPRTVLAASESLRTASETMGATALAGACAALSAAVSTDDLVGARAFLPALLLHCEGLAEQLAPFTDTAAVAAALAP